MITLKTTRVLLFSAPLLLLLPAALAAQTPRAAQAERPAAVRGDDLKVWVTTTDGSERKGTLVSFSPVQLVLQTRTGRDVIPFADLQRVETPDSLRNGMRNGAIVGAVLIGLPALAVVSDGSCRGGCAGEATAFVLLETGIGACIGAMIGAGVDRLMVRRQVLYSASPAPRLVSIAPLVSGHRKGLTLSVRW